MQEAAAFAEKLLEPEQGGHALPVGRQGAAVPQARGRHGAAEVAQHSEAGKLPDSGEEGTGPGATSVPVVAEQFNVQEELSGRGAAVSSGGCQPMGSAMALCRSGLRRPLASQPVRWSGWRRPSLLGGGDSTRRYKTALAGRARRVAAQADSRTR